MRVIRTLVIVVILSAVSLGSACRVRPRIATMEPRFKQGETNYVADARISVPSSFRRIFRVDYMNTATTKDGILKVQLKVSNRTRVAQILQYKFQWTDRNGMAVDTPTSRWIIAHIQPGEVTFINGVAPSPDTVDFIVSMKQHRPRRK